MEYPFVFYRATIKENVTYMLLYMINRNKCVQYGDHGLSDFLSNWGALCGGLRPQDDGGGGGGNTYQERLLQRVFCPKCNVDLVAGSLDSHSQSQHGVDQSDWRDTPLLPHPHLPDEPKTYRLSFPWK